MDEYLSPASGEFPPIDQDLGTAGKQFSKKILENVLAGRWPAEPHEEAILREFKASGLTVAEFMRRR
tara:strand:- start:13 stop:213 length:201 start_codon:yes stop_codon:yes gene_type:complete